MKKIKILKTLLIPTLGISAIGTIAAVSTSCSSAVVPIAGVSLDKESLTLGEGDSDTLIATVLPEDATDKSVTWISSDPNVASVDINGNVHAGRWGSAKITVTTNDGGFTDTCQVTVNQGIIHVIGVLLDKSSRELYTGDSDTLTATVHPEDATDKSVTWSSSNSSVATVDNNGKVTAVSEGSAKITVKTNDGGFTDTYQVTVNQKTPVTGVSLDKESLALDIGDSDTLAATVLPESATDKSVTWSSSNSSVATVDNNGNLTAVGKGQATITVTTNDGGYEDYCNVTVVAPPSTVYMCVTAHALSSFELKNEGGNNPDLRYSVDGKNWATYSEIIDIPANGKIYLKGDNLKGWSQSKQTFSHFYFYGNISISGNVMALLDNGTGTISSIPNSFCFYDLFYDSAGITSVSEDFLPATGLTQGCYSYMFSQCTSLTTAPALPATTLATDCYHGMFRSCASLTTAPALPATTLAVCCYWDMFNGCISLTTAPALPATILSSSCYRGMFYDCYSLTTAPELPARILNGDCCYWDMFAHCYSLTTAPDLPAFQLSQYCYRAMFYDCTSLTTAPDLPATTITAQCYYEMFYNCSSLTSIRIGYTGTWDDAYILWALDRWVKGVAPSGTFYYKGSDPNPIKNFGFPSGWTINPN